MGTIGDAEPATMKSVGVLNGEDEESPIEEVRLTVGNTDDPTLPVWTFRMWFLGLLSCGLLSFLNQFFSYRTEPLVITQITVLVASLPIGRFMAAVLPTTKFGIPGFGSRRFSLNPGPFNMKEHVLISIFANAGSAFGNGSAYAVGIIDIIKALYKRNISFLAGWLLIITTQVKRLASAFSREVEQRDLIIADKDAEIAWLDAELAEARGERREEVAALEVVLRGTEAKFTSLEAEVARLKEEADQLKANNKRIADRAATSENELATRVSLHEIGGALYARLLDGLNIGRRVARLIDPNFPVEFINQNNRAAQRREDLVAEPRDSQGGPPAL